MNVTARTQDHGDYRNGAEIDRAQIRVIAKAEPKPGNKTGSVKDAILDCWFRAWPKDLAKMEKGGTYNIEFKYGGDNGDLRFISKVEAVEDEPPQVAQKVAQTVRQAPRPQPVPQHNDTPAPRAKAKDPTPERIFVCGGLNAAITSHQCNVRDVNDIIAVANNLRDAWAATLGADEIA